MTEPAVVITGSSIQAYRYLATLRGLEMELANMERGWPPTACPTRGMALGSAKRILFDHKLYDFGHRLTRKLARKLMADLCLELGLTKEE